MTRRLATGRNPQRTSGGQQIAPWPLSTARQGTVWHTLYSVNSATRGTIRRTSATRSGSEFRNSLRGSTPLRAIRNDGEDRPSGRWMSRLRSVTASARPSAVPARPFPASRESDLGGSRRCTRGAAVGPNPGSPLLCAGSEFEPLQLPAADRRAGESAQASKVELSLGTHLQRSVEGELRSNSRCRRSRAILVASSGRKLRRSASGR
jgi:hypothetical protein